MSYSSLRSRPLIGAIVLALAGPTQAQLSAVTNASPRGLTDVTNSSSSGSSALAEAIANGTLQLPSQAGTSSAAQRQLPAPGPMPPDPASAGRTIVFGSQMFTGRFASEAFGGFNGDYRLTTGDRVLLRLWGAFNFSETQTVDPQGNIFVPNVGPVRVIGVRNADLSRQIEEQVKRIFRSNVSVYASLEASQPVKVYVTGFVRAPGLYGGLSSDSVLYYLDRAGGIDPERGSFLAVEVLRGSQRRAVVDLYRFLLEGRIEPLQLQDGDTVVVAPRRSSVTVSGEVYNPYQFEFSNPTIGAAELLAMARPRPGSTHMAIVRREGAERRSEYHPLSELGLVTLQDGDEVSLTSDKVPGTILVRIEGVHLGERTLVLPYGSRLKDALARLKPAPQSNMSAVQLFRKSVAVRQKELLESSLRSLETYALTARSATSEEAALRTREADQILKFIERARRAEPRGQIVVSLSSNAPETLLEDGDTLQVPLQNNLILVSGEVLFPNALVFERDSSVDTYIDRAGGFTQGADRARVMVLHQDGSIGDATRTSLSPGDEVMVLPRIETKSVELTRGITQIIYQIAVAARIALGL